MRAKPTSACPYPRPPIPRLVTRSPGPRERFSDEGAAWRRVRDLLRVAAYDRDTRAPAQKLCTPPPTRPIYRTRRRWRRLLAQSFPTIYRGGPVFCHVEPRTSRQNFEIRPENTSFHAATYRVPENGAVTITFIARHIPVVVFIGFDFAGRSANRVRATLDTSGKPGSRNRYPFDSKLD